MMLALNAATGAARRPGRASAGGAIRTTSSCGVVSTDSQFAAATKNREHHWLPRILAEILLQVREHGEKRHFFRVVSLQP